MGKKYEPRPPGTLMVTFYVPVPIDWDKFDAAMLLLGFSEQDVAANRQARADVAAGRRRAGHGSGTEDT